MRLKISHWKPLSAVGLGFCLAGIFGMGCTPSGETAGSGPLPQRVGDHKHLVTSLAFSPQGQMLFTGSLDQTAAAWSFPDGELKFRVTHTGPINAVEYSPNSRVLATAGRDGLVSFWSADTGALDQKHYFDGQHGRAKLRIRSLACLPNSSLFAVAGDSSTNIIQLLDVSTKKVLRGLGGLGQAGKVAFSHGGEWLAAGRNDGTLLLWKTDAWELVHTLPGNHGAVVDLAWSAADDYLACAYKDGSVWLLSPDTMTGPQLQTGMDFPNVAFAPEQKVLAVSGKGGIRLYQGPEWKEIGSATYGGGTLAIAFSPDGAQLVVAGGEDGKVLVWNVGELLSR